MTGSERQRESDEKWETAVARKVAELEATGRFPNTRTGNQELERECREYKVSYSKGTKRDDAILLLAVEMLGSSRRTARG